MALTQPAGVIKPLEREILAKTKKLKCYFSIEATQDLRSVKGIDAETELMLKTAQEVRLEIGREILTDIRNNVRWKIDSDGLDDLDIISSDTCNAEWMVMSTDTAKRIKIDNRKDHTMDICKIGKHKNINVYVDPLFPVNQVLLGKKADTSYWYCPYVPFTITPIVLDPEVFCPRRGYLTRYGKHLPKDGPKSYALVKVN
jgi:hypothetical protein